MNILEMTDKELYELGQKVLADKLGADQVERFIRQCKPGKGDYSVDRHKLLANQGDIDTIVERIQDRRAVREAEERARAERFAMPQKEIQKMTDIEILEIGNQVLINKLGVAGLIGFIRICQELNGGHAQGRITNTDEAKEYIKLYTTSLTLNPRIVEDYIKRGNAYSYIGEYDKAIADYSEVIKLRPDCAEAYSHRAKAHLKKTDFDKAIEDYTKAIELNPQDVDAYYARGKLYDMKKSNVG
ncbi:tetratricopeptide repeat protein [Candidatus Poribacteria bacterium]|nr:tetratricopeptide repeat protein [Candidatus Poribacteria bacterium]